MSATTSTNRSAPSIAAAVATPAPRVRLRITRRGRRVLGVGTALGVASVVAAGVLLGPGAMATGAGADVSFDRVTVDGGETLWHVAGEIAPTKDPRDVVSDIVRLNNLPSAEVAAGQTLAVPEKYSR
jgi:hypothetical protein